MTQTQQITKIKEQIQEIKTLINNYKQEITQNENTLLTLIQELSQIELNIKENKQNYDKN